MEGSSKVAVEYHDSTRCFANVEPHLRTRLPLRNLFWRSPSRPVRAIDSLQVELVPGQPPAHLDVTSPLDRPRSRAGGASAPGGIDDELWRIKSNQDLPSTVDGLSTPVTPAPARRHQIPGLRQSPYLKLLLVRCDDNEFYKTYTRKHVKDWIKDHTFHDEDKKRPKDNHDAFEWLILHVVYPGTPAAAQPRLSTTGSGGEKQHSGWRPGKSSQTLFEKFRADFNSTGKHALDRVAQVRLSKGSASLSPEEEASFEDVMEKLKSLILASFTSRVAQYEDDIREREAQRPLPGWNFSTFFTLKEGLARGFESVNLVDDALAVYDQLSIGLDTVIQEQITQGDDNYGGSFLQDPEDLTALARQALTKLKDGDDDDSEVEAGGDLLTHPLDLSRKPYRELIVANKVSVFDFRCYIFSRQKSLLLRLGNPDMPEGFRRGSVPIVGKEEDVVSLAATCSRGLYFTTIAARVLRDELGKALRDEDPRSTECVIRNIVASWTFAVAQELLDSTVTRSLSSSLPSKMPRITTPKSATFDGLKSPTDFKRPAHPLRTSSLPKTPQGDRFQNLRPLSGHIVFEDGHFVNSQASKEREGMTQQVALNALAAHRGHLYLAQRKAAEEIAVSYGWLTGVAYLQRAQMLLDPQNSVKLTTPTRPPASPNPNGFTEATGHPPLAGIVPQDLRDGLQSRNDFRHFYEEMCDLATKNYRAAGRSKATERIMGDVAMLKFEAKDYEAAAALFKRMAPAFATDRWTSVESSLLKMQASCVKLLERWDEYAQVLIELLAQTAATKQRVAGGILNTPPTEADKALMNAMGYLQELLSTSARLKTPLSLPMSKYFCDIDVDQYLHLSEGADGFTMNLQLKSLFDDSFVADRVTLTLIHESSEKFSNIHLDSNGPVYISNNKVQLQLSSSSSAHGIFLISTLAVEAKNIRFTHNFLSADAGMTPKLPTSGSPAVMASFTKRRRQALRVVCYPRSNGLFAKVSHSRRVHIEKTRGLEVEIAPGDNTIQKAEVKLKSATAGMRLHTGKATMIQGDAKVLGTPQPGIISVGELVADEHYRLLVPYELELQMQVIEMRLEITYHTESGTFAYHDEAKVLTELPLDVNVFDIFKANAFFSKFSVRTAIDLPLLLLKIHLKSSNKYVIQGSTEIERPLIISNKQPASFTFKTSPTDLSKLRAPSDTLALTVSYTCLDDVILDALADRIEEDVRRSPISSLSRLVSRELVLKTRRATKLREYDRIALLGVIPIPSFEMLQWNDVLNLLEPTVKAKALPWLQAWHEEHLAIPCEALDAATAHDANKLRQIIIDIDVPKVDIVHTARLHIEPPDMAGINSTETGSMIVPAGIMLKATLSITHTRRWSGDAENPDELAFTYELFPNPETWLIAGNRKAYYTARADETKNFELLLMPLRPGRHLLPGLEIHPVAPQVPGKKGDAVAVDEAPVPPSCELDYQSHAVALTIIPDWSSTTVILGDGDTGHVLLVDAAPNAGAGVGVVPVEGEKMRSP